MRFTTEKKQSQGSDLKSSEENFVMGSKEDAKQKLNWESNEASVSGLLADESECTVSSLLCINVFLTEYLLLTTS